MIFSIIGMIYVIIGMAIFLLCKWAYDNDKMEIEDSRVDSIFNSDYNLFIFMLLCIFLWPLIISVGVVKK